MNYETLNESYNYPLNNDTCGCLNEYQEYYERIRDEINNGTKAIEPNSDRAHNAAILCAMLDTANTIDMYCGEMSVFQQNFYNHIDRDNPWSRCSTDNCSLGQNIKASLTDNLRKFLNRDNAKLTIYVQNPEKVDFKKLIDLDLIKSGIDSGKISINRFDKNSIFLSGVKHITCTDRNTVRIEINPATHEALCATDADKSVLDPVHDMFNIMKTVSSPLSIN